MQQNNQYSLNIESKKWYYRWWAIALFIILTLILIFIIAFSFFIYDIYKTLNTGGNNISGYSLAQSLKKETRHTNTEGINNYWFGAENPKVIVVEFADFSCPYCKESYNKIRELSLKYKDDIKFVYRDFPVRESSIQLSMAARCAGEQGLFWPMHDRLFQRQGEFQISDVSKIAIQVGVDTEKFNKCYLDNKYINDIRKDFSDAEKFGVEGTPTWFVNGYKIPGPIPTDNNYFEEIILTFIQENS